MKKVSVLIVFSVMALVTACYKEISFDVIPYIEFSDLRKEIRLDQFSGSKKDSVILTIKFQDGDGDLGLNEEEKKAAVEKQDFNYIIRIFRKKNGVFTEVPQEVPYSGFFPRLKSDNKKGPIEGKLDYSLVYFQDFTPKKDSLKYQITIKDRSGNVSNTIESKVIVLNEF